MNVNIKNKILLTFYLNKIVSLLNDQVNHIKAQNSNLTLIKFYYYK